MEPSSLHPSEAKLIAFNHGELGEGALEAVSLHLDACPGCCGRLHELSSADKVLSWLRLTVQSSTESSGASPVARQDMATQVFVEKTPTVLPAPARSLAPAPTQLGDYEILAEVGRGGMGVVYKARQRKLNRLVAVKTILAHEHASDEQLARFQREAELAAQVHHPNVVQIYEIGMHGSRPFLAMEWVDGGTLARHVGDKPLAPAEAAQLTELLARAVHAAHMQGVLHRDLKPANILLQGSGVRGQGSGEVRREVLPESQANASNGFSSLTPDPWPLTPKISDFGLARPLESQGELTQAGTILGTPEYMAPEQAVGGSRTVGPAADVYSLGVILYKLLTGRPPFHTDSPMETLRQVAEVEPVAPRLLNGRVPRDLETICLKCLEKAPARRYASAAALADDLRRFTDKEPIMARPAGLWERTGKWARRRPAVAALLAAVVLLGGIALGGTSWGYFQALAQAERADTKTAEALRLKADADKQLERADALLYASQLELAQNAWREARTDRAWHDLRATRAELRGWEYRYLLGVFNNNQRTLSGHDGSVDWVAYTADGALVASAGADATLRLWDVRTAQVVQTWKPASGDEKARFALSADGTRLAAVLSSPGRPGRFKVRETLSGREVSAFQGHVDVHSLCLSPDGKTLASSSKNTTLKIWNADTGAEILSLALGPKQYSSSACFSPCGKLLATVSGPDGVKVLDAKSGKVAVHLLMPIMPGNMVTSVCFSPDGKLVAGGTINAGHATNTRAVKVWNLGTGQLVHDFRGHARPLTSVAFSPDGKHLASASKDMTICVWELETNRLDYTLKGHRGAVNAVAFSTDGKHLASGSTDRTVKFWDARPQQEVRKILAYDNLVKSVCFDHDGQLLATAGLDKSAKICDPNTLKVVRNLDGHDMWVRDVRFSPDGRRLASAGADKKVILWHAATGDQERILDGHTDQVSSVCYSPDGKQLASASWDQTIRVWDLSTGRIVHLFQGHPTRIQCVAFSPDGKHLASGGYDHLVKVWDLQTERVSFTLEGHGNTVSSIAFSHDGKWLASASEDGTAKVWDAHTGETKGTLDGHAGAVHGVAFSPDGQRLVTAGADQTVRLWNAKTGHAVLTLRGHGDVVYGVCFSPDGARIASASRDSKVLIWDAPP